MPDTRYERIDLSKLAFWERPMDEREAAFAELRERNPVSWQPPAETGLPPSDDASGFWALTLNADIREVSIHPEVFSSSTGGVMFEDVPAEILENSSSILSMDNPRHHKVRGLISSVFTPRRLKVIQEQIERQAHAIVSDLLGEDSGDFVSAVSARLPMWTLSEMVGIPEAQRQSATDSANAMVAWNDPEFIGDDNPLMVMFNSMVTLHGIASELCESRRATPQDDIVSALVQAEIDGEKLTDQEIAAFFVLLCVAGNDTTRQTTSHAIRALDQFPEQRNILIRDFDGVSGTAVDEFIRWASPVITFRRTALQDYEVGGQHISSGDKVVMFYPSGNRDERAFNDPRTFDVERTPNRHVGFGGGGMHYCLGAHVAKMQLSAIFRELLTQAPNLSVGEPERLASNFIDGIKRMPYHLNR
jgi:cytochrome P450